MKKSVMRAAYNIVTQAKDSVPDSKLYRELREITGIGDVFGKNIRFTPQCRTAIERFFDRSAGQPLLYLPFDEDSRDKSSTGIDEKWAKEGVFANLINFTTLGQWPIKGKYQLPDGFIASSLSESLDFSGISAVVLVENGEVLTKWAKTAKLMPEPFRSAVAIYRGHGHNIKKTKALIKSLDIPVGLYFDFDPAGLDMAKQYLDTNCVLLIPHAPSEHLHNISKAPEFAKQFEALQRGLNAHNTLFPLFVRMKEFEIAVMQERMAEEGTQLKIYEV